MKTLFAAMLGAAIGAPPGRSPPDAMALDFARTRFIHDITGLGGVAHCVKFTDFKCRRAAADPNRFRCDYREYRKLGPWARQSAVLRWDGEDWRWVSGDTPKCSIWLIN